MPDIMLCHAAVLLLSTMSLDPCLWRKSDHPAFGPLASLSLHLASTPVGSVHKSIGDNVGEVEEMMCVMCVWMLQRGYNGDGCVLASNLCKYDLRKGNLFVLSWARVRRVTRGSIS